MIKVLIFLIGFAAGYYTAHIYNMQSIESATKQYVKEWIAEDKKNEAPEPSTTN
jgi:hypothetical protein